MTPFLAENIIYNYRTNGHQQKSKEKRCPRKNKWCGIVGEIIKGVGHERWAYNGSKAYQTRQRAL